MEQAFDFLVVGSGFGGSVSALRLAEKGYRVAVLEAGKRFTQKDFPETNWEREKFFWAPKLDYYGIMRITPMRHVTILSGAGVGGGSLVYANTLLVPPEKVFTPEAWGAPEGTDVYGEMKPFYATAQKMLGAVPNPLVTEADVALRETATELGFGDTFHTTNVGVFFGEPDKTVPDPFFGGEGPERTGCNQCGGCMVGCRYGAKNTLDKNYLYFAEKLGVQIFPETTVESVRALPEGGYEVVSVSSLDDSKDRKVWRAPGLVLSAGVLGTMPLLLAAKEEGALPNLSARLGDFVRTNSEAILNVQTNDSSKDYSKGIAITSGVYPDEHTHIEVVRYPEGSDAMGLLYSVFTEKWRFVPRLLTFLLMILLKPLQFLKSLWVPGWAKRSIILLVMQTLDSHMRLKVKKRIFGKGYRLTTELAPGSPKAESYLPVAYAFAKRIARKIKGFPQSPINELVLDNPVTAHIMGGACIGRSSAEGVIDRYNQVFGHPNLYVIDGSMIPANLGVNPSLTITAKAEHAMAAVPLKAANPAFQTMKMAG
jgi:cholesterol oxidase